MPAWTEREFGVTRTLTTLPAFRHDERGMPGCKRCVGWRGRWWEVVGRAFERACRAGRGGVDLGVGWLGAAVVAYGGGCGWSGSAVVDEDDGGGRRGRGGGGRCAGTPPGRGCATFAARVGRSRALRARLARRPLQPDRRRHRPAGARPRPRATPVVGRDQPCAGTGGPVSSRVEPRQPARRAKRRLRVAGPQRGHRSERRRAGAARAPPGRRVAAGVAPRAPSAPGLWNTH